MILNEYNRNFNKSQINNMKGTIHDNDNFKWDDTHIFNILKSELPKLKLTGFEIDNEIYKKNIKSLSLLINEFNDRSISDKEYKKQECLILEELTKILGDNELNKQNIYLERYYNQNLVNNILKYYNGIFIEGDGGIGKSFLLYEFVKELDNCHQQYIISFGKFNKKFDNIDIQNVIEISKKELVYFIIDAFNEYDETGRKKIIRFISQNLKNRNIKIIISYRNYSLSDFELKIIRNFFDETDEIYELYGIDLDNALSSLINDHGLDVTKYEEIINLQNPLYIKMLKKCLSDEKIVEELLNSESQITYIYEQFIKSIDLKVWNYTKNIVSNYMYDNEVKQIEELCLKKLLNNDYIFYTNSLKQQGLLESYIDNGKKYYYFTIDSMNDFIIARPFLDEINNLTNKEIVTIIDNKLKKLYSLYTALILCLFDKFNDNIDRAIEIIKNSQLHLYFDIKILRMVKFNEKNINIFQQKVNLKLDESFNNLIGYPNKPYNFCNFFNKYFLETDKFLNLIYNSRYNYIDNEHLKQKAKVITSLLKRENYNSSINTSNVFKEYFWFSFWLMGTTNEELRDLSKKNVYEMCYKCNELYEWLIDIYDRINDEYLKVGIVEIICRSTKKIVKKYNDFLKNIYYDKEELNSLKIIHIDNAIYNSKREYIKTEKLDLLKLIKNDEITEEVTDIFFKVDMYDKYILPWRYWSREHIDCNLKFIKEDKKIITNINTFLTEKYPCLLNNITYCKFNKEDLLKANKFIVDESKINEKKYLQLFQTIIYKIAKQYKFDLKKDLENIRPESFNNTLAKKIITISRNIMEGTLMCNYYIDEFCINKNTFENKVGYGIYNPYEYEDSFRLNYVHPYSTFNLLADKLDERLETIIFQTSEKKKGWEDDVNDIKKNLFNLIKPISLKKEKWVLLSASLRYIHKTDNRYDWMDTYLLNSTFKSKKSLTGIDDRYITIEQKEYSNSILDYIDSDIDECSIMNPIKNNSEDFPDNSIVLPPANMIKRLALHYRPVDSSWIDKDGNIVIISNNNSKNKYNNDTITNTVYIKEKYFSLLKNDINYFSFTSRSRGEGYSEKSEFHMQYNAIHGEIKCINNSDQKSDDFNRCNMCKYNKIQTAEEIKKLQKDWEEMIKVIVE